MSLDFEINSGPYNYSGFGSTLNDEDEIEENIDVDSNLGAEVYDEILKQIGVDKTSMNEIINKLLKTTNLTFNFIRVNNDCQILFFSDNLGHVSSIPLKKIIETHNEVPKLNL